MRSHIKYRVCHNINIHGITDEELKLLRDKSDDMARKEDPKYIFHSEVIVPNIISFDSLIREYRKEIEL